MKHRIISIIIIVVMVLSIVPAVPVMAAYSGTCGENVTWSFNEATGVLTISGEGDMADYKYSYPYNAPWSSYSVVEAVIEEGVTSIGHCAFFAETTLVKVTIPEGVVYIGNNAFNRTSLTNVKIPDSVKSIGSSAFSSCSGLTSVIIPDNVIHIGANAFGYNENLSDVKMGKSVKNIEYGAFADCPINEIDLPESLVAIGNEAFSNTRITNFNVPGGIKYIGAYAFEIDGDYELQSLNLPDGIINIGRYLNPDYYEKCTSSVSVYYEGEYLLEAKARNVEDLNLIIKDGTKVIADYAFENRYFESVYIPSSVEYIGNGAFSGASIERITVEGDLKEIGYEAFYDCDITEFNVKGDIEYINDYAFACCRIENFNVEGKIKIIGDYAFSEIRGLTNIEFSEGLEIMGHSTFYQSVGLESVTLPETLDHIKESTFFGCYNLKNADIPESVTVIGQKAFYGCRALTDITIGASIEKIAASAFENSGLTNIAIADAPIRIDEGAFDNTPYYNNEANWENGLLYVGNHLINAKDDVAECNIREGTVTIADSVFYDNNNITSVKVPEGVLVIGESAFAECDKITEILLPEGLQYIGDKAFLYANYEYEWVEGGGYIGNYLIRASNAYDTITVKKGTALIAGGAFEECWVNEIVLPDGLEYICPRAFASSKLRKINIPNTVKVIEENTFFSCKDLKEITIPENIERIDDSAFIYCSNLEEITVPKTVTAMGDNVFYLCESLKKARIYADINKLGYNTFFGCSGLREIEITNSIKYFHQPFSGYFATICCVDGEIDLNSIFFSGGNISSFTSVVWTTAANAEPESISIEGSKEVKKGGKVRFKATVLPENAKDKSVTWSSSNESVAKVDQSGNVTGISNGYTVITAKTVNSLTASRLVQVLESGFKVAVKGYDLDDVMQNPSGFEYEVLSGATVTVGGVTKITDSNGEAFFEEGDFDKAYSDIIIYYNDEYETKESTVYFADYNDEIETYTFCLRELDESISFKCIDAVIEGQKRDLLKKVGTKYISYLNDEGLLNNEAISIKVGVEWGKHKSNMADREIWLEGTVNKKTVPMAEGENTVRLTDYFDVEEPIKLVATTKDKDGNTVRCEKILPLMLRVINVKLEVPDTEDVSTEDLYLLENLSTKISLGDIGKAAGEIGYENGIITVEFGGTDKNMKDVSLFGGNLVGKAGPKVSVTGRLQIPVTEFAQGKWSGGIKVNMGREASLGTLGRAETVELFGATYNFSVNGLPCYIDSNLKAGLEGSLDVSGDYEKAGFSGSLNSQGSFAVSGGLGAGYNTGQDEVEVKFGAEGKLDVKLPATYEYILLPEEEQLISFDPEIKGSINGKVEVKILAVDIEGRLEFGSVTWTKNGAVWKVFGNEIEPTQLLENGSDWKVIGRGYLENGGGFLPVTLFEIGGGENTVLYENIIPSSDGVITNVDGVPYVYFTNDLETRDEVNSLALMYTKYENGSWSSPEAIYDDGTVDTDVEADGGFVVWENSEREFSGDVTLDELLRATNISVAVMDGEEFTVTEFGSENVYDFGAKIKRYGDKAYVAWLSNTEGDFTSQTGVTSINYAVFDGEWSEVNVIEDIGAVTSLNLIDSKIVYKKGTDIYAVSVPDETKEIIAADAGRYAAATVEDGTVLTYLDSDKKLHITENGEETAVIKTAFSGSENPRIATDGSRVYIFWKEAGGIYYVTNTSGEWSGKLLLTETSNAVSNLTAAVTEDGYTVAYYETSEGITNLVAVCCEDGYDYAIEAVEYNPDIYAEAGVVGYTALIKNNGELTGKNVEVRFTEDGEIVYKTVVEEVIMPGEVYAFEDNYYPEDWSVEHEYTIEVVCPGDRNEGNNAAMISVGETDISVKDVYFAQDDIGNEKLYVVLENSGTLNNENIAVKICENNDEGTIVEEREADRLAAGDSMLMEFDIIPEHDVIYRVDVTADGDVNEYNNTKLVTYEHIDTVSINISANNSTSGKGILIIAVYDKDGKLKNAVKEEIDLSQVGSANVERCVGSVEAGDKVKAMIWDSVTTLEPIVPAVTED